MPSPFALDTDAPLPRAAPKPPGAAKLNRTSAPWDVPESELQQASKQASGACKPATSTVSPWNKPSTDDRNLEAREDSEPPAPPWPLEQDAALQAAWAASLGGVGVKQAPLAPFDPNRPPSRAVRPVESADAPPAPFAVAAAVDESKVSYMGGGAAPVVGRQQINNRPMRRAPWEAPAAETMQAAHKGVVPGRGVGASLLATVEAAPARGCEGPVRSGSRMQRPATPPRSRTESPATPVLPGNPYAETPAPGQFSRQGSGFGAASGQRGPTSPKPVRYRQLRGTAWAPASAPVAATTRPPPDAALTLQHAHGFRGSDCQNNAFVTAFGEVVYHVAALGVVCDPATMQQRFFISHDDDILCLAQHPDRSTVATGQVGREACILVWDSRTLKLIKRIPHACERFVGSLGFSADGKQLVSTGGDNFHSLSVWNWREGMEVARTRGGGDRVIGCRFSPLGAGSLVQMGEGHMKFWTLNGSSLSENKAAMGDKVKPGMSILAVEFLSDGTVLAGTADGVLLHIKNRELWGLQPAHEGAVRAICQYEEANNTGASGKGIRYGAVSGGRDGKLRWWGERMGSIDTAKVVAEYDLADALGTSGACAVAMNIVGDTMVVGTSTADLLLLTGDPKAGFAATVLTTGHFGDVRAIAADATSPSFVSAAMDGTVRLWCLERHTQLAMETLHEKDGSRSKILCASFSPDGAEVALGFESGAQAVFDVNKFALRMRWKHHREAVADCKWSPDGALVAFASHDNLITVYDGKSLTRQFSCRGHSSFVNHIDFSADGQYLQSTDGAGELVFWDVADEGSLFGRPSELADIDWYTYTCHLGFPVAGIWPPGSDGTDVNAVDRNGRGDLLATGDDFKQVRLLRWPCNAKQAQGVLATGHASHVMQVRFSGDDRFLMTAGGLDQAVLVWSVASL